MDKCPKCGEPIWFTERGYARCINCGLRASPATWSVVETLQREIAARDAVVAQAEQMLVAAIYFADNSDYLPTLWSALRCVNPELAELLKRDESTAYNQATQRADRLRDLDARAKGASESE